MLIPEEGKWRWNDGPLCDTKEEALNAAAKPPTVGDSKVIIVVMDCVETMGETQ